MSPKFCSKTVFFYKGSSEHSCIPYELKLFDESSMSVAAPRVKVFFNNSDPAPRATESGGERGVRNQDSRLFFVKFRWFADCSWPKSSVQIYASLIFLEKKLKASLSTVNYIMSNRWGSFFVFFLRVTHIFQ